MLTEVHAFGLVFISSRLVHVVFCDLFQYICFVYNPRCSDMWASSVQLCLVEGFMYTTGVCMLLLVSLEFLAMDVIVETSLDLYKVCYMSTILCMVLHRCLEYVVKHSDLGLVDLLLIQYIMKPTGAVIVLFCRHTAESHDSLKL